MTEPKKKLTQAQMLEQAQAELATTKADLESANSKAGEDGDEMESLKADVAAIKESVATLSESVATLAESVKGLKSEDEEEEEGDGEGSEGDGEGSEGDGDSEEDQDEETKAVLTLCSLAISGLMEDNATLKSLEQNIQKRASAKLSSMCAELGISPAMKTGAASSNSANAGKTTVVTRSEFDKMDAKQKNNHLRAGGKIED